MSWVGWRCTKCGHEMQRNQRQCSRCAYTVFEPIHDHERPDWAPDLVPADSDTEETRHA